MTVSLCIMPPKSVVSLTIHPRLLTPNHCGNLRPWGTTQVSSSAFIKIWVIANELDGECHARTSHHRPHLARPHARACRRLRDLPPLEKTALGVQLFREDLETESEFVTVSYWADIASMSDFTGGDPNKVHHLPRDREFLIELPNRVQVLRILVDQQTNG
jgi:hypothetical protein